MIMPLGMFCFAQECHCSKTEGGAECLEVIGAFQWRIQGEIPGCHGSPLSVYSYVALVQLLASYLSVFVAIVV